MASRKEVSPAELLDIMNQELARFPQCEGVRFTRLPTRLKEPDETGCNWDQENSLRYQEATVNIEECKKFLPGVLSRVADQYNLK